MTQRADAVRSRKRIVDAAREVFAADGAAASLDRIARRAGVGSATLYRHFSNRDALLDEVFRDYTADLATFGAGLLVDGHPAAEALRLWLSRLVRDSITQRGLADAALTSSNNVSAPPTCFDRLISTTAPLLHRAQAAGVVRASTRSEHLLAIAHGIALSQADATDTTTAEQLLSIVLDGVIPGAVLDPPHRVR